ncbi:MAG: ABC transporter permease [Arcobacter sp.]|mgnify:CR=1 FL=1|nr:MAG: ABC transporter permease [Arcobacter sp.]
MMQFLPGDTAMRIAAGRYGPDGITIEIAKNVRNEIGLDRPLFQQYYDSLIRLVNLDLGYSLVSGEKVIDELKVQLGYSLYLAFYAFFFSIIIAIPIGIYTGSKQNGIADNLSQFVSVSIRALPPFILGLILIIIFSVYLNILPTAGFEDWTYMILPALTLSLGMAAVSSRLTRDSMISVVSSSYYSYGRYKGLDNKTLIKRHGIKNAAIPIISFLGLQSIYLIEGVVVVETVFAFPGIGHALLHAVIARDIPMIQGSILTMGILFVLINILADVLNAYLDPRIGEKNAKR